MGKFCDFISEKSCLEGTSENFEKNKVQRTNSLYHRTVPPVNKIEVKFSVLVDLVAQILALVPPWTRVYRVQRDIPMPLVTSGVENGNLRELALARMKEKFKKKSFK